MSKNLFAHMAYEAGFEIVEQHVLDWEGEEKIDCVTLLRKPKESGGFLTQSNSTQKYVIEKNQ